MRLLVFVGPRGAGKDTAYEILKKKKLANNKLSFAEPLKTICTKVFDLPQQLFNDPGFKDKPFKEPVVINIKHLRAIKDLMLEFVDPYDVYYNLNRMPQSHIGTVLKSPRQAMQYVGTNIMRAAFDDFHCHAVFSSKNLSKPKYTSPKNPVISVTDCRFPNEMHTILTKYPDAKFYYIERPEAEANLAEAQHESETLVLTLKKHILDRFGESAIIKNDGSEKDFAETLTGVITKEMLEEMKNNQPLDEGQLVAGSKFRWTKR